MRLSVHVYIGGRRVRRKYGEIPDNGENMIDARRHKSVLFNIGDIKKRYQQAGGKKQGSIQGPHGGHSPLRVHSVVTEQAPKL